MQWLPFFLNAALNRRRVLPADPVFNCVANPPPAGAGLRPDAGSKGLQFRVRHEAHAADFI